MGRGWRERGREGRGGEGEGGGRERDCSVKLQTKKFQFVKKAEMITGVKYSLGFHY